MIDHLTAAVGLKTVAALVGAGIAALRASHLTLTQRVVTFLGGYSAAEFLTDPVMRWMSLTSGYEHGIAFVLGLFGMTLIEAVMTVRWAQIIESKGGVSGGGK